MDKRATVTNGDRYDAFDGKNHCAWRAGQRAVIKARANRRLRRQVRRALRAGQEG